ncbi:MAG: hypothetical protein JJU41_12505 [Bacteroidetes bacterium]|nr:hypothetical protein [Bacteroidota bacterium]MCH8523970.1 hypothetical protein [Balneolales bacterium]
MKHPIPILSILVFAFFACGTSSGSVSKHTPQPVTQPAGAQATASVSEERVYVQIQYLEVQYASLMNEILSQTLLPFQQQRVNNGDILDWSIYETLISGPGDRYGMISITKTTHYNELFREFSASENHRNLGGTVPRQSMMSFHGAIRVLYSEIWILEGTALPPGDDLAQGNYLTKNYLDSRGRSGEHRVLELDFWQPIHVKRIENGILNAWGMYTLSKPGGSSRKYTYSTIDYYETLGDVAGFDSREMARLAHPELSEDELSNFFNRTGPSRTAWKTELWRRILGTSSPE